MNESKPTSGWNEAKPYIPDQKEPLDPGPVETRQHWQIVAELKEKLSVIEAKTMTLIAERDSLRRWKDDAMTVESWWKKLDDVVRRHPDTVIGAVVVDEALRLIRERDDARSLIDQLRAWLDAGNTICRLDPDKPSLTIQPDGTVYANLLIGGKEA